MRIELITEISGEQVIGLAGLKSLADSGNIEALNTLGEWILMGYECSPDVNFAFKCFRKAAKKGNTQAMLNLGICYMNGYGVEEDFYTAERWIRAAHECGDEEAIAVCEQLYTTTIGDHKPDLKTYVDLVYDELSKEEKEGNESVIKEMLLAQMVLSASGVSDEDLGSVWGKVTENDIVAFETMNDIHYGEPVKEKKKTEEHISKKQYCEKLAEGISEKDEKELTDFIALLYNLCDSKEKVLKDEIKRIKYCQYTKFKKIPWLLKALYEVETDFLGEFKAKDLKDIVDETIKRAERLDNEKLEELFFKTNKEEKKLIKLRNILRNSSEYQKNVCDLWINKVSKTINELQNDEIESVMSDPALTREGLLNVFLKVSEKEYEFDVLSLWEKKVSEKYSELEEKEVSEKFDQAHDNYFKMHDFLKVFKTDVYRKNIKTEWEPLVKKSLCELQKAELDKICFGLESKSREDLKYMLAEQIVKYSFDKKIFESYRKRITERIDFLEAQDLEDWCKDTDNFSIKEYAELIEMIKESGYDKKKTQPYISQLEEKKENLIILDNCDVKKLEEDDLDRLNEKISAVHFSTLDSKIKDELVQRINSYIDLIHEGKDKASNRLREKCTQEKFINFTDTDYADLIKEVQGSRILQQEKNEILEEIESRYKERNKIKFSFECSKNKLYAMDYLKLNNLLEEIESACLDDKQMYVDFVKKHIELYNECEKQRSEIYNTIADEVIHKVDAIMHPNSFVITHYKSIKGFYDRTQRDFVECIEERSFKEKGLFEKVASKGLALINGLKYIFILTLDSFVISDNKGIREIPYSQIDKFKVGLFSEELILIGTDGSEVDKWQFYALRSDKKELASFFNQLIKVSTRSALDFKNEFQQCEDIKKRFIEQRKAIGTVCDDPRPQMTVVPTTQSHVTQPMQQVDVVHTQPDKTTVEPVVPVSEPSVPQVSQQQAIVKLVQALNAVSAAKSNAAHSVQHTTEAESPKQSEKIGINEMREYAKQLRISNLLDFDNVSIEAYLNRYPIFSRSIKAIESDEYGVVLIKNSPVDILLTNTSVLWQLNCGRKSLHICPSVEKLNSILLKNGKISDTIAMCNYEVCPNYDVATNECILAFLKYAALGIKTEVKQIPQQDVIFKDQQYIDNIDASMPLERQIAALKKKYISNVGFKYHVTGEVTFAKKYPKAVAAYANVSANENPLVMEDSTIFGSAKTGFVLTDRQIFIKSSDANKVVIPVESVVAVFKSPTGVMGDYRIKLMSKSGDHIIASFTDGEKAQKATEFFEDLFELLKRNREKNIALKSTPVIEATNESAKGNTWTCSCGNKCIGNFCDECGKPRNW